MASFASGKPHCAMTPDPHLDGLLAHAVRRPDVFIRVTAALARHQAAASAARAREGRSLGPVDGLRVSWKDLFDIEGTATTCGSRLTTRQPARADAAAVARLAAAGAVCIGKTNLSEFAFNGLGTNPNFGTPRNPVFPRSEDRLCGGSSSGAAAAVALGLCELAIGTDTSGSVRVPAALCGLLGFRASGHRYPQAGLWTLSPTLDTIGLISGQMAWIRAVDEALTDIADRDEPCRGPYEAPQFLLDVDPHLEPAVSAALVRFAEALRDAGYRVEHAPHAHLAAVQTLFDKHGTLVGYEALDSIGHQVARGQTALLDSRVGERLHEAQRRLTPTALETLHAERLSLMHRQAQLSENVVFLAATTPMPAPRMGELASARHFHAHNRRILSLTMPASFLDMPAISVPIGRDEEGAPIGAQMSVPQGRDRFLLHLAASLENDGLFTVSSSPDDHTASQTPSAQCFARL